MTSLFFAFAFNLGAQPVLNSVTSLGGNGSDVVTGMVLDDAGNSYLSGNTTSFNLATPGTYRAQRASSNLYSFDSASGKVNPLFPPVPIQIVSLSADSQHAGTVYAATTMGLIKTTDRGLRWTTLTQGLPTAATPLMVAAASQSNVVYAEFGGASYTSQLVYRSSDGGTTWAATTSLPFTPQPFSAAGGIAVDPFDADHVIYYGPEAFMTSDGGESWTAISVASGLLLATFDPAVKGRIYGYSFTTPYLTLDRSMDGGQTFVSLPSPSLYFVDTFFPDPLHAGTVYLGGSGNSTSTSGVFKSADAGMTWAQISSVEARRILEDVKTGAFYLMAPNGIYITTDSFQTVKSIVPQVSPSDIALAQSGTLMIATHVKSEGFVSKLDPNGKVIFTSYLGGLFGSSATALAVDTGGSIYIGAQSGSPDFPQTALVVAGSAGGLYLMKMSGDGAGLLFSTAVGSSAGAEAMTVDAAGNIYVAGTAGPGYPTTPDAPQPEFAPGSNGFLPPTPVHLDAFVSKFAPDGNTLIYSTYFGTAVYDRAHAMVVDTDGSAYVVGSRLWKLNPAGTALTWSTILTPGEIRAAALDQQGNLYVCGGTYVGKLYTSPNAYQAVPGPYSGPLLDERFVLGNIDAFVAKFSSSGSVIYSTLFGGRMGETGRAIMVDGRGSAIVLGTTQSTDLPQLYPFQGAFNGHTGFLAKFNGDGSQLLYSTFLGDARQFDAVALARLPDGNLMLAGYASGAPVTPVPAVSGNNAILNVISERQTAPALHVDGVLNEANLSGGPLAPGEWIVVRGEGFGSSPQVLLGGVPISVMSATGTQILARIPDETAIGAATFTVNAGEQSAPDIFIDIVPAAPAYFSADGTGYGQALALNADGTLNGPDHPAALGSTIQIAINGIGPVGANTIQAYFQGGIIVPASVQTAAVPGLPGDSYTVISTVIPNTTYLPGPIDIGLVVNGVTQTSPLFAVTITVR